MTSRARRNGVLSHQLFVISSLARARRSLAVTTLVLALLAFVGC
jgi:hypothetical protein